jgi:alpha-tubulin suppressor-like RCC1 family protein
MEGAMQYFMRLSIAAMCVALAASGARAESVTQVAAGLSHSCALTTGGAVLCWGDNSLGQLGDGWWLDRLTPGPVYGLGSGVTAIAAGHNHTCALTTGGGVVCWGGNNYGQLGDGTTTNRFTPTAVAGLASGVAAIGAGDYGTCALTTGGAVVCWGHNNYGQLGDGTTTDRGTPVSVVSLESGVEAIAVGGYHTCALTTGGSVLCWGNNSSGQLGDGTAEQRLTPTAVIGLPIVADVTGVAVGGAHTCAVLAGMGVACWGYNNNGQLGDGTTTSRLTPMPVSSLGGDVAAIAAGDAHACAATGGGGLYCWGKNNYGQIGDGTVQGCSMWGCAGRTTPTPVSRLGNRVASVVASSEDTCAVTTTAGAACWGRNTEGRLGDGTTTDRYVPTRVTGLEGELVADLDFTSDLRSDVLWRHATAGDLWLWPMDGAAKTAETYVRTVADTNWEIRGLGDQTGDGTADLLWRHKVSGQIYLWNMDGPSPPEEAYVATVDPSYDIVGQGDFNGDGRADIMWRHAAIGAVWIWLMSGPEAVGEHYMAQVNPGYVVKGSGDVDGDGKDDIVWHHAGTGATWVWLMDGTSRLSEAWVGAVPDTGYQIQGVADFTGDAQDDILWWHATRGEVWLWTMADSARAAETYVATVPDTGYRIAGTGDYNGDGKADILWHHATRGEVWVWLMNGATRLSQAQVGTVPDTGYRIVR